MTEIIHSVTREKSWLMVETMDLVTKERSMIRSNTYGWGEPLRDGPPLELMNHWNELRLKCVESKEKSEMSRAQSVRRCVMEKSKIFVSRRDDVDRIFEKSWCVCANNYQNIKKKNLIDRF